MKVKNKISIIILACTLFIFTGCSYGSYSILKGDISSGSNGIEGKYKRFTGVYEKKVKLKEGESIEFTSSVNTTGGEVFISLIDSKDQVISELKDDETVKVNKADIYRVKIEGKKHDGDFKVSFNKKP